MGTMEDWLMRGTALLLVACFSLAFAGIEVWQGAKGEGEAARADVGTLVRSWFWLHALFLFVGNFLTTIASVSTSTAWLAHVRTTTTFADDPFTGGVVIAVVGCFGFSGVLSRVNISLGGQGFLALEDWQKRSRALAVASVLEVRVRSDLAEDERLVLALAGVEESAFLSAVANALSQDQVEAVRGYADAQGLDPRAVLARAFVQASRVRARALAQAVPASG